MNSEEKITQLMNTVDEIRKLTAKFITSIFDLGEIRSDTFGELIEKLNRY